MEFLNQQNQYLMEQQETMGNYQSKAHQAKLKKLKELGKKKQTKLLDINTKRQAMFWGQTQYKFQ